MNPPERKCLIRGCGRFGSGDENRPLYGDYRIVSKLARHFVHFFPFYRAGGRTYTRTLTIGRKKPYKVSKRQSDNSTPDQ